jgi:hypothetical protein
MCLYDKHLQNTLKNKDIFLVRFMYGLYNTPQLPPVIQTKGSPETTAGNHVTDRRAAFPFNSFTMKALKTMK